MAKYANASWRGLVHATQRLAAAPWLGSIVWPKTAVAAVSDLLFPPSCLLCGVELAGGTERFCQHCYHEITALPYGCPRCAKPVPYPLRADEHGCPLCRTKRLHFSRTIALGIYGGTLRQLVIRVKQAGQESLTLAAGRLLGERIHSVLSPSCPDVVIPVPMHWLRRWMRGVNDAELLAEVVGGRLGIPVNRRLLRCRRRTRKQGTLTPTERRKNVRGAYRVGPVKGLQGRHVLLVDDVMTTGATANEVARVLRRHGAREISVAVVARGVGFE